jgi:hypothetical protein
MDATNFLQHIQKEHPPAFVVKPFEVPCEVVDA